MTIFLMLGVAAALLAVLGTYGRTSVAGAGTSVEVSADGAPEAKTGGVTIDWATVAAVAGADVTWNDGVTVKIGEKGLRYGQVITKITASGKYGPYDPAAVDGRQTLTKGEAYILNRSALQLEPKDEHPEAIFGGRVFWDRIINSGGGAASLAAGPTEANVLATFPRLQPARAG
jgi:hypothetical protein